MKKKYTIEKIDKFFYKYSCLKEVLSEQEINTLFLEWESNNNVNPHDYFWLLFNKALVVNAQNFKNGGSESDFYNNQSYLYYNMAYFRRDEGAKKETINQFIRLAFQSEIDRTKSGETTSSMYERSYQTCVISKINGSCEYATSQHLKRYPIDEFLDKCFIATDKCTSEGGCYCSIGSTIIRDSKGNLIWKKEEINTNSKSKKESKGCVMVFIPIIILITIASIFTF
jgi:hypothetical protein